MLTSDELIFSKVIGFGENVKANRKVSSRHFFLFSFKRDKINLWQPGLYQISRLSRMGERSRDVGRDNWTVSSWTKNREFSPPLFSFTFTDYILLWIASTRNLSTVLHFSFYCFSFLLFPSLHDVHVGIQVSALPLLRTGTTYLSRETNVTSCSPRFVFLWMSFLLLPLHCIGSYTTEPQS